MLFIVHSEHGRLVGTLHGIQFSVAGGDPLLSNSEDVVSFIQEQTRAS